MGHLSCHVPARLSSRIKKVASSDPAISWCLVPVKLLSADKVWPLQSQAQAMPQSKSYHETKRLPLQPSSHNMPEPNTHAILQPGTHTTSSQGTKEVVPSAALQSNADRVTSPTKSWTGDQRDIPADFACWMMIGGRAKKACICYIPVNVNTNVDAMANACFQFTTLCLSDPVPVCSVCLVWFKIVHKVMPASISWASSIPC